ncbi:MAG: lysophospholipid acyltransferase family protein, partial [Pirellulaceae bacterium]|nr:lysophospholipid acyltransferase family protein [Pirellulaceae bacterium]
HRLATGGYNVHRLATGGYRVHRLATGGYEVLEVELFNSVAGTVPLCDMFFIRQYLRNHPPSRSVWRGGGMGLIQLVNLWMSTLNYRGAYYAAGVDPTQADFEGPAIFLFWHEYIPVPLYLRPNCRLAVLLSQHQDAELLSHAAHFAGLETVRGSTHRGATGALRTMLKQGQDDRGGGRSLVITPDGPRGPRRQLAPGCIYLSSRLQVPLILLGIGYDRPWRYRRVWDQFAIPRPYSRARVVSSPRVQIPPDLDREQIETHRSWIENLLNQVTDTAERWAADQLQLGDGRQLTRAPATRSPC